MKIKVIFYKAPSAYKKMPLPMKAILWMTICNVLLKGIGFFTTPLFTRILSTEEYGKLSVILSYEKLIMILATLELSRGPYIRAYYKFKDDQSRNLTSLTIVSNLVTCVVFGLIFLFWMPFYNLTCMGSMSVFVLFLYALFQPAYVCWMMRQRIVYNYKWAVFLTMLVSISQIVVPIAALYMLEKTAEIKYIYSLVPQIFIYVFFYFNSIKPKYFTLKNLQNLFFYTKFYFRMAIPFATTALSYLVLNQSDRIMIGKMIGNAEVAVYSVAYSVSSVTALLQDAISNTLLPWIFNKIENKQYKRLEEIIFSLLIFIGLLYVLYMIVCQEIVFLLFQSEYWNAIWSIPGIVGSSFFMLVYSIFIDIENYYEKNKSIFATAVVCASVNIILNYFGIQMFGYIVCAYTTLISYMLCALMHYTFACKAYSRGRPLSVKRLVVLSGLFLFAMVGVLLLYRNLYLKYIVLVVILLFGFIKRKIILMIIKEVRKN